MMTPEFYEYMKQSPVYERLIESAKSRKDIWPSRDVAQEWFAKRYPWEAWDERLLQSFVVSISDLDHHFAQLT